MESKGFHIGLDSAVSMLFLLFWFRQAQRQAMRQALNGYDLLGSDRLSPPCRIWGVIEIPDYKNPMFELDLLPVERALFMLQNASSENLFQKWGGDFFNERSFFLRACDE